MPPSLVRGLEPARAARRFAVDGSIQQPGHGRHGRGACDRESADDDGEPLDDLDEDVHVQSAWRAWVRPPKSEYSGQGATPVTLSTADAGKLDMAQVSRRLAILI